jgi:hypothetical protein
VRAAFNPNLKTSWFSAMTQVINQITLLTVILTGAALIREREQGTVEHLLVMPIVPIEIMLAKMIANGLVILVAAMLSLQFVVHWWIGSPINGSLLLFLLGAAIYALVVAALGIMLGTLATTMGQFGLLAMPVLMVTQLLSGSSTPMESMPVWLQYVMQTISPTPHDWRRDRARSTPDLSKNARAGVGPPCRVRRNWPRNLRTDRLRPRAARGRAERQPCSGRGRLRDLFPARPTFPRRAPRIRGPAVSGTGTGLRSAKRSRPGLRTPSPICVATVELDLADE